MAASPTTSDLAKVALLENLVKLQPKEGDLYTVSNGVLRVGSQKVDPTPIVETETEARGKSIVAMRIEISVDGVRQPKATYGAIGIAATKHEAIPIGLGEWYLGFGRPYFEMLKGASSSIEFLGYKVYPGAMGLRGGVALGWVDSSDAMNRKVLNATIPAVGKTEDIVVLDLKVMVPASGYPHGECRVDGTVSRRLADKLAALDWPRSEEGYMFKQAYVLRKI